MKATPDTERLHRKTTRINRKTTRINISALSEEASEYLVWWSWAERATMSAWAGQIVQQVLKANRAEVDAMLERAAYRRSMDVEDLKRLVLQNPRLEWSDD